MLFFACAEAGPFAQKAQQGPFPTSNVAVGGHEGSTGVTWLPLEPKSSCPFDNRESPYTLLLVLPRVSAGLLWVLSSRPIKKRDPNRPLDFRFVPMADGVESQPIELLKAALGYT